ncbi:MAG: transketolase C-terminal domain-containing protein [Desulfobacterales bacterium]|jgi:pyruvate/2-oxoacid:ferredoxin oxidoreductase alpha subunit
MKTVLEGSHAVSEAVRLARVQVVSAYPITPQTHIVEAISEQCQDGRLAARFLCVESEHSAMAAMIGAASGGVRTFTATSSQGLAYMHELLHWASAARLPIVMAEVNRALAPGWNIWTDQTDSLSQRDTGWIQLYCEDGQEVLDTTLMAFSLAETVNLPVMVILDAFFLSHTFEPIDVPDQEAVDRFLPPYRPRFRLDTADPCALGQMAAPGVYMEMRRSMQEAMEAASGRMAQIEERFAEGFGRRYAATETVCCEDARVVLVTSGTVTATARVAVERLRRSGERVGLLKIRTFRPFPADAIRRAMEGVEKAAVIDRNFSVGAGGIFAQEVRAALCREKTCPQVFGYVAGLGGRDITPDTIEEIYTRTRDTDAPEEDSIWIGLNDASR